MLCTTNKKKKQSSVQPQLERISLFCVFHVKTRFITDEERVFFTSSYLTDCFSLTLWNTLYLLMHDACSYMLNL